MTSLRPCTQTPHSQGQTCALGRNAAATSQEQKTHRQRATQHTPGCWFSNHVPLLGCSVGKTSLYTSDCCQKLRTTMQITSEKDLEAFRVGPNQTERLWVIKAERTWRVGDLKETEERGDRREEGSGRLQGNGSCGSSTWRTGGPACSLLTHPSV